MLSSQPYTTTISDGPSGSKLYIWGSGEDQMIAEFYPFDGYWTFTVGSFPAGSIYPPIDLSPYQPTGRGNARRQLITAIITILDFVDTLDDERVIKVDLFHDTSAAKLLPRFLYHYAPIHGYEVFMEKGINTNTYSLITGDATWVR